MPNAPIRAPKTAKPTPPPAPPRKRLASAVASALALEQSCTHCWGAGGGTGWTCEHCAGRGKVPSLAGRELLDFIERWSKP